MRKLTHQEYVQKLKSKNIKVVPVDNYKGMLEKINHKCICNNIWEITPSGVLSGSNCGCGHKTDLNEYQPFTKKRKDT